MDSSVQVTRNIEMELNASSAMAKKLWRMVRVVYFMLRKGISKGKLMMDLKLMMMKRNNKLNNKSITSSTHRRSHDKKQDLSPPPDEYEFSCSNTPEHSNPTFKLPFTLNKRKKTRNQEDEFAVHAVVNALEMLNSGASSPMLPGMSGKSPMVRQLRVTDSPFPLNDIDHEDSHVDEAAQEFIEMFYQNLRRQNAMAT